MTNESVLGRRAGRSETMRRVWSVKKAFQACSTAAEALGFSRRFVPFARDFSRCLFLEGGKMPASWQCGRAPDKRHPPAEV